MVKTARQKLASEFIKKAKDEENNDHKKNVISKKNSVLNWEKNRKNYLNFSQILNKKNIKIAIVETEKGTGKTFGAIYESMKEFKKTGRTSILIRNSNEEIKAFVLKFKLKYFSGDFPNLFDKTKIIINNEGIFAEKKIIGYKGLRKTFDPAIMFVSSNIYSKRSSVSFPKNIYLIIEDEISPTNKILSFNDLKKKALVWENILRGEDPEKLLIFLNKNYETEPFYYYLKINKEVEKMHMGQKKIIRIRTDFGIQKIFFWKAKRKESEIEKYKKSEIIKLGSVVGMDHFLLSGEALKKDNSFKKIEKLGVMKFNLIVEGMTFSVWLKENIFQFSEKYDKNFPTYYYFFEDFESGFFRASKEFLINVEKAFELNKIEFSNQLIFSAIVKILKSNEGKKY